VRLCTFCAAEARKTLRDQNELEELIRRCVVCHAFLPRMSQNNTLLATFGKLHIACLFD